MAIRTVLAALVVMLTTNCSFAVNAQDHRYLPITQKALSEQIKLLPFASEQQMEIITRAYNSGLAKEAYDNYTSLWVSKPKNPYINLLRGVAAENYWRYTFIDLKQLTPDTNTIFKTAYECLTLAAQHSPVSAEADREYGYFLWQFAGNMHNGLKYLQRASLMNKSDPRIHAMLGDVYSNPSSIVYQPKTATVEYHKAIALDQTYAYPHSSLVLMYIQEKKYQRAQQELQKYLSLTPLSTAEKPMVRLLKTEIKTGLGS